MSFVLFLFCLFIVCADIADGVAIPIRCPASMAHIHGSSASPPCYTDISETKLIPETIVNDDATKSVPHDVATRFRDLIKFTLPALSRSIRAGDGAYSYVYIDKPCEYRFHSTDPPKSLEIEMRQASAFGPVRMLAIVDFRNRSERADYACALERIVSTLAIALANGAGDARD